MSKIIPFPSYKVGLQPKDKVAVVTNVEKGHATAIKVPNSREEIGVFAHNDLMMALKIGDWVRFERTDYGALVIEELAKPGELPLPRADFSNGCVQVNQNDPVWRLYGK